MQKNIRNLSISSLFIALFVILSYFAINLTILKITLSGLPLILGSLLLGPYYGLLIGGVGAFLEQAIRYGLGPTSILWIIPILIRGLVIGLYAKKKNYIYTTFEIALIMILSGILLTLLNTVSIYINNILLGNKKAIQTMLVMIVPRMLTTLSTNIVYIPIVPFLLKRIKAVMNRSDI